MYKIHMMFSGEVKTPAKHELVKGIPDFNFQDLYDFYLFDEMSMDSTNAPFLDSSASYENNIHSMTSSSVSVQPNTSPSRCTQVHNPTDASLNDPIQLPNESLTNKEKRFAPLDMDAKSFRDMQKIKELKTKQNQM